MTLDQGRFRVEVCQKFSFVIGKFDSTTRFKKKRSLI